MKKILLISLLFVPVFASASIDVNLKYGATGSEVIELQEFLVDKGFLVSNATGNFFSLTNSAVIKYQGSVGLPTTGFVGPMTREKINAELIAKTDTANQQEVVETGSVSTISVNDKITQMLNQIKVLQELIAKQNQTQQSILTSTQQIQQNTTPAPVYVPPAPVVPTSIQFTAVKGSQSSNCIPKENYSGNDGVNVVLGTLLFTPQPTKTSYKVAFNAHTSTINLSTNLGNKPIIFARFGNQFLSQGRTELNFESFDSITEPQFWLKEIKDSVETQLIIDSMFVDGVAVLGLPITFEPTKVIPCQ